MKKFWLSACGVVALVAASPVAFAADLSVPVKAPPPMMPPPLYNWSGFYIGGNVGGVWTDTTFTDNLTGVSLVSSGRSGFIGGGQLGYNWQVSPQFVIGIEWLFDGTDLSASGGGLAIGNTVVSSSLHNDWLTTLTGRIGYAANNWLFYAKGGGAWVENTATVNAVFANGAFGSVSGSNTNTGWTAGLGFEYGFAPNWTFKVEWDYIGLDHWNLGATPLVTVNPLVTTFVGDGFNLHRNIDMVTAGVNYKFSLLP